MSSTKHAASAELCEGLVLWRCVGVARADFFFFWWAVLWPVGVCVCVCWCSSWTRQWTRSAVRRTLSPRWASTVWWRCQPSPQAQPCPSQNTSAPSVVTAPQVSDVRLGSTLSAVTICTVHTSTQDKTMCLKGPVCNNFLNIKSWFGILCFHSFGSCYSWLKRMDLITWLLTIDVNLCDIHW